MKTRNLMTLCLIIVTLPGCLIFRACGGNPSIDRTISPDEIIGEWYLDNSAIEAARRSMRNVPGYVIKDNGKDNKIVLNKDGTCIISLVNLGSYDDPEYFEIKGKWSLTNIPYKKGSSRANNIITLPWKPQFAHIGLRMKILEEDGDLVLYHYMFRIADDMEIVKYRRLSAGLN